VRRSNLRDLGAYLERVEQGRLPEAGPAEVLDARTARGEALFLALRESRGLAAARFADEFGRPPRGFYGGAIEELVAGGLLVESGGGDLRLSARGRLLSNSVFERFV
jgi:coproporphyrinogen III oxidase-like Fe-S oxidoreductase